MTNVRQLSFSSGEIAPSLQGRVDQVKYATGLKTCRNFMVQRHGGVTNRPGTIFDAEVSDSSKAVRLIPFVFNPSQTYVLEFGDTYMRVHQNGALLTETAKNIVSITKANPCVIEVTTHGYTTGDEVAAADIGGMTELNGRNFKVVVVSADTFEIQYMDGTDVDSTLFNAYISGGTTAKVYEIATPYLAADLPELQYVQSADTITLVHPSYEPRELSRTGHIIWSLDVIVFAPALSAPENLVSDSPGAGNNYKVTAGDSETGEESLPSVLGAATTRTSTLTWDAVDGADYYEIYLEVNGLYGWIGTAASNTFKDATYNEDLADNPPEDRQPFSGASNYPSAVTFYQQRLLFANSDNNPERVWSSKTGLRKNFMISTPLQDDDAVTFTIVGKQVNEVQHLVDVGSLVILTTSSVYNAKGDGAGTLTPTGVNPVRQTGAGAAAQIPLEVGDSALYVQARGSVIRDLLFSFEREGYRGNELTIFANHLFDKYTIADWAYQEIPNSTVWVVRSDGVLLGLTYVREHQVIGWHRHDTDGLVENVCVVPEGTEDALYMTVKRTIDGKTVRYIERMATRQVVDIKDSIFMDSTLSYDGENVSATTMTLSGGAAWTYDEDLTLTASVSAFTASDVDNAIFLTGSDGTLLRCPIMAYTSPTVVTVNAHKTVPVSMQSVAITTWGKAVDTIGGLWHLEGKEISVFADGFVVANPSNDAYTVLTVEDGEVTLDKPYVVIHAGLPITADMETLNLDFPGVSTVSDKKKNITQLSLLVEETRGLFAGPDTDNLREYKLRNDEGYDDPVALATDTIDVNITAAWKQSGRIVVRQIDPVPATILSVIPTGYIAGP